jgi:hypothetical protein
MNPDALRIPSGAGSHQERRMKFMTMVTAANPDKAGPPPPELYQAIAELGVRAGEALKDNGGMSTVGTVSVKRGELIVDGPYAEAKEAVGGFAIYELDSKEEAVRWASDFMELHRRHWPAWEGEVIVRQMVYYNQ